MALSHPQKLTKNQVHILQLVFHLKTIQQAVIDKVYFQLSSHLSFSQELLFQHNQLFYSIHLFLIERLDIPNYTEKDYVDYPYLDPMTVYLLEFFYGEQEQ